MTESKLIDGLHVEPFMPLRLHLVSGKTLDIHAPGLAHPLRNALLVLRNPTRSSTADGYDVVAYANIERIEQLDIGKPVRSKRKPA
jgi:hypothetical protein